MHGTTGCYKTVTVIKLWCTPASSWICCSSLFCAEGLDIVGGWKAGDSSLEVDLRELDSERVMWRSCLLLRVEEVNGNRRTTVRQVRGRQFRGAAWSWLPLRLHGSALAELESQQRVPAEPSVQHTCSTSAWGCRIQHVSLTIGHFPNTHILAVIPCWGATC